MRPNKAGPSASEAHPVWEAPGLYEIADCQPDRVGRECGKRFPSRGRTGSAWPAPIQARLFI